jgi:hypothetical protein
MDIPQFQLFLGFLIDTDFQLELDRIDRDLKSLFINEGDDYLQQIDHQGKLYLGKYLGERSDLQTLHDVEINIYSLISKVTPNFPCHKQPLRLFPAQILQ